MDWHQAREARHGWDDPAARGRRFHGDLRRWHPADAGKAARTKDLSSYSLGNIVLGNLGNVIQSIYVFHLPAGPMWVLHTFYLLSTALMLFWYLRYTQSPILGRRPGLVRSPDATRLTKA